MKAKNIFQVLTLCSVGILATACGDDDKYTAGEWDATEGYQNIAFPDASSAKLQELDPTQETSTTITITRSEAGEAVDVPLVITENTDGVFTVGPCHFDKDSKEAQVKVDFPNAQLGKTYYLSLEVQDKQFVSSYTTNASYTYSVIRVKWNRITNGEEMFATFDETFWWEESSQCIVEQRDDDPTQFRLKDPFINMPDIEDYLTGRQSEYITFRVLQKDEPFESANGKVTKISTEDLVYFDPINTGDFHSTYGADVKMYHPSDLASSNDESMWKFNKVLYWQDEEHKLPGLVQLAPLYYMDGIGGWDNSQNDGVVLITFPGYTPLYEASIEEDFEWDELFTGDWNSELLGTTGSATLYKGTCINETDDCGTRFAEQNGEVYTIASPYAEDYNIYFCVKDGKITVPAGYEMQATGLDALGKDVYATISAARSEYTDNVISLYMIFTNEDGSMTYGEAIETLSNITYTTVGTADYTYTIVFADEDEETGEALPYLDAGLELQQRDDKPEVFRLLHWGYDTEFYFTWDQQTNKMTVPVGATGFEYGNYGMVYVADIPNYYGAFGASASYDDYPCTYDPETQTASLTVVYFVSAGSSFGNGVETMKINMGAVPEPVEAPLKLKARKTFNLHPFALKGAKGMLSVKSTQAPTRITKNTKPF